MTSEAPRCDVCHLLAACRASSRCPRKSDPPRLAVSGCWQRALCGWRQPQAGPRSLGASRSSATKGVTTSRDQRPHERRAHGARL